VADIKPVVRFSHGVIMVHGTVVASEVFGLRWPAKEVLNRVRERTPDEWWIRAFEILDAEEPGGTGGPLGYGVDHFSDEHAQAVPPEIRDEIQEEVYEEAATLIGRRLDEHLARLHAALFWAKQLDCR
jgi:hypothetical protein